MDSVVWYLHVIFDAVLFFWSVDAFVGGGLKQGKIFIDSSEAVGAWLRQLKVRDTGLVHKFSCPFPEES